MAKINWDSTLCEIMEQIRSGEHIELTYAEYEVLARYAYSTEHFKGGVTITLPKARLNDPEAPND